MFRIEQVIATWLE